MPHFTIDFKGLKAHIARQEDYYAQYILGLPDALDCTEYHRPCPLCGGHNRFYFRPKTGRFYCRRCEFKGDLIDLVARVRGVTLTESFRIIAEASGFASMPAYQPRPEVAT